MSEMGTGMSDVKVVAWFRDGSFQEYEIPQTIACHLRGPSEAIELFKKKLGDEARNVERFDVEEDFL